jgi:Kiwa protein KwaB-like
VEALSQELTPEQALGGLAALIGGGPGLSVATVAGRPSDSDPPELRTLNLAGDAQIHFLETIAVSVGAQLDPLGWTLRAYDPVYKPDENELEWLELAEVDAVQQACGRFENLAPNLPFNETDDAYVRRLQYWGATLEGGDGQRAYFFRKFTSSAQLRNKSWTAMVQRDGSFQTVEERIFLFDRKVDCFVFGGYVFILRKQDYRRIFDQMEEIRLRAKAAASALHEKLPISNFDDFERACGSDSRLADKVLAVRRRDYFDQLSYELVKPVIEEFNLGIPTSTDGDGVVRLEFVGDPQNRFRILKLVDDDFLRSSMTDHRYEVNSKTEPA